MIKQLLLDQLAFTRQRTLDFLDKVAREPDADKILGWRPGPGRAHIAWQLMHLGATEDRHLNVQMRQGEPAEGEYVKRFAGGSTPDDDVPPVDEIRRYLAQRRQDVVDFVGSLEDGELPTKAHDQARWTFQEWLKVLAWHESHHHGQAHLTLNLYRAAQK